MTPRVTLYTRRGCHLCQDAKAVLDRARALAAFTLDVVDIDDDPVLARKYNQEVPVIEIDGVKAFKYHVTVEGLLKKLSART